MTTTWSLEQLLSDPQLTRAQIEMLDAEDRANGIEMVRVINHAAPSLESAGTNESRVAGPPV